MKPRRADERIEEALSAVDIWIAARKRVAEAAQ
jgi:hypothetical protein